MSDSDPHLWELLASGVTEVWEVLDSNCSAPLLTEFSEYHPTSGSLRTINPMASHTKTSHPMTIRPMTTRPKTTPMDNLLHGQFAPWRICPMDNSPHRKQTRPMDDFLHEELAPGQVTLWTTGPKDYVLALWTTSPMDNSSHGKLVPWTTLPIDNSSHRQLAPWTTRPMETLSRDNSA